MQEVTSCSKPLNYKPQRVGTLGFWLLYSQLEVSVEFPLGLSWNVSDTYTYV